MKQTKVNICGIPHTIRKCKDEFTACDQHFGEVDYKTCEILLADDLTETIETETLIHEILHSIFFHIGRNDISQDENFIDVLSNAMIHSFSVKTYEEGK